jgi:hypothetical protein
VPIVPLAFLPKVFVSGPREGFVELNPGSILATASRSSWQGSQTSASSPSPSPWLRSPRPSCR